MKKFSNTVIINGERFTNIVEANSYSEALKIQKLRKQKSRNKFTGRLIKIN